MPEEVLFHKYKNDPNIISQFMAIKAGSRENAATNQRRTDFDNDSISRLLNALANLSISLPSKEVFAISFRFQRAKTTIFIAGNDTVPTDMQDHLRRMWAHLQSADAKQLQSTYPAPQKCKRPTIWRYLQVRRSEDSSEDAEKRCEVGSLGNIFRLCCTEG